MRSLSATSHFLLIAASRGDFKDPIKEQKAPYGLQLRVRLFPLASALEHQAPRRAGLTTGRAANNTPER